MVVEGGSTLAEGSEELQTGLMPCGGQQSSGSLWAGRGEEIKGLVMRVGQTYRNDDVTHTHIESWSDEASDMELLEGYFTTLLHLCFIFAVLAARLGFNLYCGTCTARLKLNFGTQYPLGCNLVFTLKNETWN